MGHPVRVSGADVELGLGSSPIPTWRSNPKLDAAAAPRPASARPICQMSRRSPDTHDRRLPLKFHYLRRSSVHWRLRPTIFDGDEIAFSSFKEGHATCRRRRSITIQLPRHAMLAIGTKKCHLSCLHQRIVATRE